MARASGRCWTSFGIRGLMAPKPAWLWHRFLGKERRLKMLTARYVRRSLFDTYRVFFGRGRAESCSTIRAQHADTAPYPTSCTPRAGAHKSSQACRESGAGRKQHLGADDEHLATCVGPVAGPGGVGGSSGIDQQLGQAACWLGPLHRPEHCQGEQEQEQEQELLPAWKALRFPKAHGIS